MDIQVGGGRRLIASAMSVLVLVVGCGKAAPSATPVPATAVQPATSTALVPPTVTPLPPTSTPTTIPATPTTTHTPIPSTDTATATPAPTDTPVPPTGTATPSPTLEAPEGQAVQVHSVTDLEGLPIDAFFEASYRLLLQRSPEKLTALGIAGSFGLRNDRLDNLSDAYIRETQALESAILALLQGTDWGALSPDQQLSVDVYEWYLTDRVRGHAFMYYDYPVHHFLGGYHEELVLLLTEVHPLAKVQDAEDYISRLSQVDDQVEQLLEGLRRREAAGVIPPTFIIDQTISVMTGYLGTRSRDPTQIRAESLTVYTVLKDKLDAMADLGATERESLLDAASAEIKASFIPAYVRLLEYLDEVRGMATDDAGAWKFPNGAAYYDYILRDQSSADVTPEEVHAIGLAEVTRIQAEMRQAFDALGYPQDARLGELLDRAVSEAGFHDIQTQAGKRGLLEAYDALLQEVDQRLDSAFDIRPKAQVEVVGGPMGGYYVPGSSDGSRPGAFHVATTGSWAAKMYMAPVAYHEAIPGHHYQIAIAQELDLPTFRTDVFFNGYVEGWALYAERLAWELGMYDDDPYGNLARLDLELLRAVRLVVDTGIHALGWTRGEANAKMAEAFGAPPGTTYYEVDRYIVLPAQATGYKIGMLKILELRQRAIDRLGDRFDLKEFHNAVLGSGSVPLDILERVVNDYIEATLNQ